MSRSAWRTGRFVFCETFSQIILRRNKARNFRHWVTLNRPPTRRAKGLVCVISCSRCSHFPLHCNPQSDLRNLYTRKRFSLYKLAPKKERLCLGDLHVFQRAHKAIVRIKKNKLIAIGSGGVFIFIGLASSLIEHAHDGGFLGRFFSSAISFCTSRSL